MISNRDRRLSITPQGQLIPSPTGNLTLYVDLEIAEERAAKLEAEIGRLKVELVALDAVANAADRLCGTATGLQEQFNPESYEVDGSAFVQLQMALIALEDLPVSNPR